MALDSSRPTQQHLDKHRLASVSAGLLIASSFLDVCGFSPPCFTSISQNHFWGLPRNVGSVGPAVFTAGFSIRPGGRTYCSRRSAGLKITNYDLEQDRPGLHKSATQRRHRTLRLRIPRPNAGLDRYFKAIVVAEKTGRRNRLPHREAGFKVTDCDQLTGDKIACPTR